MSVWKPLSEVDWSTHNYYRVDTRDFHILERRDIPESCKIDYFTVDKYKNKLLFSIEEVKALIEKFYMESGGEKEWRYFSLIYSHKAYNGWQLKYFTIVKYKDSYLIANKEHYLLSRDILKLQINKEQL